MLLVTGGLDPLGDTFSPVGEVCQYCTELVYTVLNLSILYYTVLYCTVGVA